MIFERKKYLDELIAGRGNGLVKIITGVRRCGKSFLLFDIWHNWLLEHGVTDNHIIEIQLDDFRNRRLRKPDALLDYVAKPFQPDILLDKIKEAIKAPKKTQNTSSLSEKNIEQREATGNQEPIDNKKVSGTD